MTQWPQPDIARGIHSRLCSDDPVAPADLAEAFLDPLATWLQKTNPNLDPHLCDQAAEDAILTLIKIPHSFNPNRGELDHYLRMSARGDLLNLLEREGRHRSRRAALEVVELSAGARNQSQDESDPARIYERAERLRELTRDRRPLDINVSLSREEQRVLALMDQGERRTAVFARALHISHLGPEAQRREVKRVKDRLKQRIKRARGPHVATD